MSLDAPRSGPDPEPSFADRVYDVVARIPSGHVTTYGRIARAVGVPRASRGVGWALNRAVAADPLALPCHRVVDRAGRLSGRRHFATPTAMEERLRAEGVRFIDSEHVDLERHVWDPEG